MIFGNPEIFAVESVVSEMNDRLSLRALGCFVIHVGGIRYGVYEPDATMLANSLDAVVRRLNDRGQHTSTFSSEPDAFSIAHLVTRALYADIPNDGDYFGLSRSAFCQLIGNKNLLWAPDGDEAFDDGSFVLQFDVKGRVRLIAFKRPNGLNVDSSTLRDEWMPADDYYRILQQWREAFEDQWSQRTPNGPGRPPT